MKIITGRHKFLFSENLGYLLAKICLFCLFHKVMIVGLITIEAFLIKSLCLHVILKLKLFKI